MSNRCLCHVSAMGRRFCPQHHRKRKPGIKGVIVRHARGIKDGDGTTPKHTINMSIDMKWSAPELNAMDMSELWTVARILELPQKKPEVIMSNSKEVDLKRHIKAYLGIYKEEAMDKYLKTYPLMTDIILMQTRERTSA